MRRNLRLTLSAGAAVTALLAMSACSTPTSPTGPIDIKMSIWSANEDHIALFNSIAEAYVAENADAVSSVTFETLGAPYLNTLTTQIAGGDTPDLAWIPENSATEFVESGVLFDVAPTFAETEDFDLDDLLPSVLELWKSGDGLYAYPFSNSPLGMYVNRDLVAAAGQEQPSDLVASGDWTWDEAAKIAAAAVAAGSGPITFTTPPEQQWDSLTAIWAGWGARPWSEDGATCEFNSPEMQDALGWYHEQLFSGVFAKPGEKFSFATGGSVMQVAQLSAASGIDAAVAWDFLPLPAGPEGSVGVLGQAGIGVVAKGENPSVAADFLAYFVNATNAAKLAQFFPPPRESLLNVDTLALAAPALTPEQIQSTILDVIPTAVTKAGNIVYSQITPTIKSKLDVAWQQGADLDAILTDLCATIEPQLTAGSQR